jgi:hypothetical protein
MSKAERGYALSMHGVHKAVQAQPIVLDAHSSTADAFKVIALSCLERALSNERAVRAAILKASTR